jgi:hypothetical protein
MIIRLLEAILVNISLAECIEVRVLYINIAYKTL